MSCTSTKVRKQLLLLIDTVCPSPSDASITAKTIYRACCRLLFTQAGFDKAKDGCLEWLGWDYRLFDSNSNRVPLKENHSNFKELKTDLLEQFHQVLQDRIENSTHNTAPERGVVSPFKVTYSMLAAVLQDYHWDTPLLMSPSPRHQKKTHVKEKLYNAIYLVSNRFDELSWCNNEGGVNMAAYFRKELFPSAVRAQLQNKHIKLFVVYGYKGGSALKDVSKECIVQLRNVLREVEGGVVPLPSLLATPSEGSSCRGPVVTSFLPPDVMVQAYVSVNGPVIPRHHLLVNKADRLLVIQLYRINDCCAVPLLEEGPVIFRSLGLVPIPSVSHYTTVYVCTGLVPSDDLKHMYSNRVWEYYTNPTEKKMDITVSFRQHPYETRITKSSRCLLSKGIHDLSKRKRKRESLEEGKETTNIEGEGTLATLSSCTAAEQGNTQHKTVNESVVSLVVDSVPVTDSVPVIDPVPAADSIPMTDSVAVINSVSVTNSLAVTDSVPVADSVPDNLLTEEWLSTQTLNRRLLAREFLDSNIQMNRSNMIQVLEINSCHGNGNRLALLHPLTGSLSALSIVEPEYILEILAAIVKDESVSSPTPSQHYNPSYHQLTSLLHHHRSRDQSHDHSSMSPDHSSMAHNHSNTSHDHSCISHDLSCTSHDHSSGSPVPRVCPSSTPFHSSSSRPLLFDSKEPFSHQCISDWAHLMPKYGVNGQTMEQLKGVYSNASFGNPSNKSARLLSLLKKSYSPDKLGSLISGDHGDDQEEPVKLPPNESVHNVSSDPPLDSYQDIISDFKEKYQKMLSQSELEISEVCKWACQSAKRICQSFPRGGEAMWAEFSNDLLISDSVIKEQHLEDESEDLINLKINKCLTQVILHFYFSRHLPVATLPQIVSNVVPLLQRLALLTKPANVGRLLDDTLLEEFSTTSVVLLREVYDELMMPCPPCICASDDSDDSDEQSDDGTLVLDTENENEDVSTCGPKSLESFLETLEAVKEPPVKMLRRHASFNRQISISKHPSMKKAQSKEERQKVKRSLFNGSRSFNKGPIDDTQNMDKEGIPELNVVVKETPVKKQVENYKKFKLERLRSKSNIRELNNISVIEESPRRSFYSSNHIAIDCDDDDPLAPATSIVFKTPPSKLISPSFVTRADKNLSSSALCSLFNSPFSFNTPSTASSCHSNQRKEPSTPELFGSTTPTRKITPTNGTIRTPSTNDTTPTLMTTPTNHNCIPRTPSQLFGLTMPTNEELFAEFFPKGSPISTPRLVLTKLNSSEYPATPSPVATTPKSTIRRPHPSSHTHTDSTITDDLTPVLKATTISSLQGLDNDDSYDNASLAAYALSTPTKSTTDGGQQLNFLNCLPKEL